MRVLMIVAYLACVPIANWLIGHVGTFCVPQGPCLVPVGFGLSAPSGVVVVGFALVLRDLVQRTSGIAWAVAATACGCALSWAVADPHIALASAAAFLVSEAVDFGVYTATQRRGLVVAVATSAGAGLVADSVVFLWTAFGSLDFLAGQIVGKAEAVMVSLPVIWCGRRLATPLAAEMGEAGR
jgi:queuosine precursor transporter